MVLVALRLVTLAVIAFCLLRPALILKAAVPQQNFLGVLVDDSRSLQIADRDGRPRSAFVADTLGADRPLLNALSKKFVLRFFRFSSTADRVQSAGRAQVRRQHDAARRRARSRARRAVGPAAGRAGDGDRRRRHVRRGDRRIDCQPEGAADSGLHRRRRPGAVRARRAGHARRDAAHGAEGHLARRQRRADADRLCGRQGAAQRRGRRTDCRHAGGDAAARRRIGHRADQLHGAPTPARAPSASRCRCRPTNRSCRTTRARRSSKSATGARRFSTSKASRASKPSSSGARWKTTRTCRWSSCSAPRRTSICASTSATADELVDGFPKTRDELFAYRALILGSVEAASFSPDQLRMIADFVGKRGGGLLMLGGRRSFAEGGWTGTPVGEVLPVNLATTPNPPNAAAVGARGPADACRRHQPGHADCRRRSGVGEALERAADGHHGQPGARRQAGRDRAAERARQQEAGAGRARRRSATAAAKRSRCPIQDSWQWRMTPKLPVTDTTYATFWRRLARWLVDDVPDRVMLTMTQDRVDPGQPMKLTAEVLDPAVQRHQRRARRRDRDGALGQDHRRAARMDRRARRRIPLERRARRGGALHGSPRRVARVERSRHRHRLRAIARRPTTSTSTRRCGRRCSGGSRKRPAAASTPNDVVDAARGDLATADAA